MNKEISAGILLAFVAISWGGTFVVVANAIKITNVFSFLTWRFLLSAVLFGLASFKFAHYNFKSALWGVFLGIWLFLGFALQTYALKFAYSSEVAFITGINVIIVPFAMFVFFGVRTNKFAVFGAIIAACGLYFLSGSAKIGVGIGEILSLVCAFCYAFHIAFTGVLARKYDIYALVTAQFAAVTALSTLGAIFYEPAIGISIIGGLEFSFDSEFIFALLICSVFATVFAYFVQTYAQIYVSPAKTAIILTFEPVAAGFFGYFFANEIPSGSQIFGAVLILLGIILSEAGKTLFLRVKVNLRLTATQIKSKKANRRH